MNTVLIVLFCAPWFIVTGVVIKILIKGEVIGV